MSDEDDLQQGFGHDRRQRDALSDQFDKASRIASAEPVAVVGIGCRFPGGVAGPEGYWTFLANGGDAIGEVPADRWDADAFYDPDPLAPGRMASKWGGFLPDVAGFDADFFGISLGATACREPNGKDVVMPLNDSSIPAEPRGSGAAAAGHLGNFDDAQRAGGGSGPGAAALAPDHDQRQVRRSACVERYRQDEFSRLDVTA